MAYGRLDVFYPDDNFRSFPLAESKVSVGRSPGNTITLETETLSRYHFSINQEAGDVYLTDLESQNGTYIDGVKLPRGESVPLRGGEEILAGELRLIFHQVDEFPTQPVKPDHDKTQPITSEDAAFQISVQPPPIAIPPGSNASADLSIINTGDEATYYTVNVSGVDRNWVRIDRPRLTLDPGESAQIIINIRPNRRSDTAPGEYPLNITVRDENKPAAPLEAQTHVRVLPYGGFGVALERRSIQASERFRLHVHNQGSVELPLNIGGGERLKDAVGVELVSSSQVTLPPGGRLVVQGQVKPHRPNLVGNPRTYPFDLVIRSQDPSQFMAVVGGKVTQPPMLPWWLVGVGGVVVLVVLIGLVLGVMAFTAPNPQVTALTVASTQIARGEGLELQWEAANVNVLRLLVDETPVATFSPDTTSYTLDTSDLPESPILAIEGSSTRSRSARLEQFVRVYDPMSVTRFIAQPPELVRYSVQPLTLSWQIANADVVRLEGLQSQDASADLTGTFDADGTTGEMIVLPEGDLAFTLVAEDLLGNEFRHDVVIPAAVPQCVPLGDAVPLRDGPHPMNQQNGTVPADATVQVDAQDVSGAWVRVKLDGGLSGWGARDAFQCGENFNLATLRKEVNVTPPPSTPTPAPSATPTSTPSATPLPSISPTVPPPSATPQPTTAG